MIVSGIHGKHTLMPVYQFTQHTTIIKMLPERRDEFFNHIPVLLRAPPIHLSFFPASFGIGLTKEFIFYCGDIFQPVLSTYLKADFPIIACLYSEFFHKASKISSDCQIANLVVVNQFIVFGDIGKGAAIG